MTRASPASSVGGSGYPSTSKAILVLAGIALAAAVVIVPLAIIGIGMSLMLWH